jgi:hypothetical protein
MNIHPQGAPAIEGIAGIDRSTCALTVRHFRQIVLWPLQVMPIGGKRTSADRVLQALAPGTWTLVEDEFGNKNEALEERHYREFVSFLPHVQRFLYGDAAGPVRHLGYGDAPLRIYRRRDVRAVRMVLQPDADPVTCRVAHVDLHFFHDVDAIILAFELEASELPLATAKDIMYRFGRAYPSGWTESGEPVHCPTKVEWLDGDGRVLATSDYADRESYLSFVGEHRSPRIATHWEFLLAPFVSHAANPKAALRFRQIEYYRMPVMSYLAFDSIAHLSRADFVRLAFATGPGGREEVPLSQRVLGDFEHRHCYDRFFHESGNQGSFSTRFMSCGHALTVVASGDDPSLLNQERGLLGQFRHQYFLLFLISHFHKASMLMLSDRLVATIKGLEIDSAASIATFRRDVYALQQAFMRFTQRYWFTDVSDQAQMRDLFRMQLGHLGNEALHRELRSELFDTVQYLDSDMLRRQSSSMHRLTTVTTLGLIGTTVTGFLGMNLIAEAEAPMLYKLSFFAVVTLATVLLTIATMGFSTTLTRLFDRLSGERH